jgi:hypothetical protein
MSLCDPLTFWLFFGLMALVNVVTTIALNLTVFKRNWPRKK